MEDKAKSSFEESEGSGRKRIVIASITLITILMIAFSGCRKDDELTAFGEDQSDLISQSMRSSFATVVLVSDVAAYSPAHIDASLVNAWGLSIGAGGQSWVGANGTGVSTVYDGEGNVMARPITIPSVSASSDRSGKPTASVTNSLRQAFIIPSTREAASVIYATEDGTIAAWSSGSAAVTVVDRSAVNAVYKGLALTTRNGAWYLYATDFYNGQIDVFDARFNYMGALGGQFRDPQTPVNYAPFGIRAFGEKIVVTYALQAADRRTHTSVVGCGFVSMFKSDGTFIKRFTSNGRLNAPYGIEAFRITGSQMSPDIERRAILIGNAGDGLIMVYAPDGTYMGQLMDNNMPVKIDGLWSISYSPEATGNANRLYFTAGPRSGTHGMYGYLRN